MPVFPKIEIETAQWCNLRQTLQWLKDEIRPVEPLYEPIVGVTTNINIAAYPKQMAALGAAILSGNLKLFGRRGEGKFGFDEDDNISCLRHGEREEVSISKIMEAGGFECIDIEHGRLLRITNWWTVGGREQPKEGWEYVDLSIETAALMRLFPPGNDTLCGSEQITIRLKSSREPNPTGTLLPAPRILFLSDVIDRVVELTGADFFDAAIAVHRALCSGELVAMSANEQIMPRGVWLSEAPSCLNNQERYLEFDGIHYWHPTLTTEAIDRWLAQAADKEQGPPSIERQIAPAREHRLEPSAQIAPTGELPVYVQFLLELVGELGGRDCIANRKKEDIEARIEALWRPELGDRSQNKISAMATILRPPEAQRGGAKAQRQAANETPGEA